ncbi:hypothetical protein PoB_001149000 [Plakobranchus ocellatus]|uniref:Secreted protein n=1 Tax=Plakobranchus ocellatus TaxID=259542 RepID=A0AAV3YRB7_9GAST|nr:hypothetical protein PoB_001149000 [Plakobranchus ocellatus]
MTRRINLPIIFAAVVMATLSCRQRISFRDIAAHPGETDIGQFPTFSQIGQNFFFSFPAETTHSSGKPTVSHSVQQEKRVPRSCTITLHCVALVQTL